MSNSTVKIFYRNYRQGFLISVLLVSYWGCAISQTTGIVIAGDTKMPLPYANIWIDNYNIGTTSDLNGAFSFPDSLIGKTLSVSAN